MALPVGTSTLSQTETAGSQWRDPQEIGEAHRPQMRWLSVRRNDQATLARQRVQVFSRSLYRNQAGGDCLCRSNDFNRGGVLRPIERSAHQEALQVLHNFCGQLLTSAICAPPSRRHCRRDDEGQTCVREICGRAWCLHQALPLRQWTLCRQLVQTIM